MTSVSQTKSIMTSSTLLWSLGILIRILFLLICHFQDQHPSLKYTDIDYSVFSDAALLSNVYERDTYRYTPLLAWALIPNHIIGMLWGKLLFCTADLLAMHFIWEILTITLGISHRPHISRDHFKISLRFWLTALWGLNPFTVVISTRGSAESLVAVLVLGTLWSILCKRSHRLAAAWFGLAVHFKIYPIIYALPLWFGIDYAMIPKMSDQSRVTRSTSKTRSPFEYSFQFFSWTRFEFGVLSALVFFGLGGLMYNIYGHDFLEHTYLYHISRQDHRHNFSIYFYSMYIESTIHELLSPAEASLFHALPTWIPSRLFTFAPQMGLSAFVGINLARDLPLAFFCQTFAFVMLNKVCTSQYFMWYLCLLPLILSSSKLLQSPTGKRTGLLMISLWVMGQALWLYFAFQLEHLGLPTFRSLWVASAIFYIIDAWILAKLIENYVFS